MARKRGLAGLLIVIILYFLSGAITAYFINLIEQRLPESVPLKEYLIAGLASLLGFLYWFIVMKTARKSLKKLIFS